MRLILTLMAIALVGCASKPKPAPKSGLAGTVARAEERAQGAKKAITSATVASTSSGDAIKEATAQNKEIETLLEELIKSL